MQGVGIIGWIIIGIVAGWIAEKVMRRDHGLLTNLVVGVVGAFIGGFLASIAGFGDYAGWIPSLVAAVVGACVLLFLLGLFRRRA